MASSKFTIMTIFSNDYGYVAKLHRSIVQPKVEGLEPERPIMSLTYYYPMPTLAAPIEQLLGKEVDFDPSLYDVVNKDCPLPNGEVATTKWCYAKR